MAWQLVFTNSEGAAFTVAAKDAAIPQALIDSLGAFVSNGAKALATPEDGCFYHRIVTVEEGAFHLISRQQTDSDSDGKTRQTAHFIILGAAEIVQMRAAGLTPADLVLSLGYSGTWTTDWPEGGREFREDEALSLAGLQRRLHLPASFWGERMGGARRAAILAPGQTAQSCWLLHDLPGAFEVVKLFGESMLLHPDPWQITFATSFQETDFAGHYAWRGVRVGAFVEAYSRQGSPVIDLTNFPDWPPLAAVFANIAERGRQVTPPPAVPKSVSVHAAGPSSFVSKGSGKPKANWRLKSKVPSTLTTKGVPSVSLIRLQREALKPHHAYLGTLMVLVLFGALFGGYFGYQYYDQSQRDRLAKQICGSFEQIGKKLPRTEKEVSVTPEKLAEETSRLKLKEFAGFLLSLGPKVPERAAQAVSMVGQERNHFANPPGVRALFVSLQPRLQEQATRNEIQHLLDEGNVVEAAEKDASGLYRFLTLYKEVASAWQLERTKLLALAEALPENLPEASKKFIGDFLNETTRQQIPSIDLTNGSAKIDLEMFQQLRDRCESLGLPGSSQMRMMVAGLEDTVQSAEIARIEQKRQQLITDSTKDLPVQFFDSKESFLNQVEKNFKACKYEILSDKSAMVLSRYGSPLAKPKPAAGLLEEIAQTNGSFLVCLYDEVANVPIIICAITLYDQPLQLTVKKGDLFLSDQKISVSPSLLGTLRKLEQSAEVPIVARLEVPPELLTALAKKSGENREILIANGEVSLADFSDEFRASLAEIHQTAVKAVYQKADPLLNFGGTVLTKKSGANLTGVKSFEDYLHTLDKSDVEKNLNLFPEYLRVSIRRIVRFFPGAEDQNAYTRMLNALNREGELGKHLRDLRAATELPLAGSVIDRQKLEPFFQGVAKALSDEAIDSMQLLAKPELIPTPPDLRARQESIESAVAILGKGFPLKISGRAGGRVLYSIQVSK